jgi:hypothetical protein
MRLGSAMCVVGMMRHEERTTSVSRPVKGDTLRRKVNCSGSVEWLALDG